MVLRQVVVQAPEEAKSDMTDTSSAAPSFDSNGSEGSDEDEDESVSQTTENTDSFTDTFVCVGMDSEHIFSMSPGI